MSKHPIYYPVNAACSRLGSVIAGFLTQPTDASAFICYAYFLSTMTRESGITAFVGSSESSAKGFVGMTRPSYKSFMAMKVPSSTWKFECCPALSGHAGLQLKTICDSMPASYYKVPVYGNESVDIHSTYLYDTRNILCDVFVTLWPIDDKLRNHIEHKHWSQVADLLVQAYCSHWLGRPIEENISVWSEAKLSALKKYWHTTRFMAQTFERVALLCVQNGIMTAEDASEFIAAIARCQLVISSLAGKSCDYLASVDNMNYSIAIGPDGTSKSLSEADAMAVAGHRIDNVSIDRPSEWAASRPVSGRTEKTLGFISKRRLL